MIDIGSMINERYRIIGNIGNGGMANVFLANDLILDREVAIKVLRFDFQDDQDAIRRFQREALAASELDHPNIVGVYDVGEEDGMQYLVMEYVRGTDLKKYIQTHQTIPLTEVVSIMSQILEGTALAHEHSIVHRDLKPQNILLDDYGNVKIADFGIAIALSETSLTQTNTLLGSVHYLSPEQARGSMATRQSDLYALGIILYELIMGTVPFEGESAVSIALKHFQSDVPSVRAANPVIPQALENVIYHATAKETADRYMTADEMRQDLETSLEPARYGEAVYEPTSMNEETKVLPSELPDEMPESFRHMAPPVGSLDKTTSFVQFDEPPMEKKKKKRWWLWLLPIVALGILLLFFIFKPTPSRVVPDVEGKSVAQATQLINDKKLKINSEVEEVTDDQIPAGKVVKTEPESSLKVKEKTEITLYISKGPKTIKIDDFADMPYKDAERKLKDLGFSKEQIEISKETDEKVSEGHIISQRPLPNKKLNPKKDQIELIVSEGPGPVSLRSMIGYTKSEAQTYLESKGLVYGGETYLYSEEMSEGRIIAHTPEAKSEVNVGDTVSVVISLGKEPVEPKPVEPTPVTPTPDSEPATSHSESIEESQNSESVEEPQSSESTEETESSTASDSSSASREEPKESPTSDSETPVISAPEESKEPDKSEESSEVQESSDTPEAKEETQGAPGTADSAPEKVEADANQKDNQLDIAKGH